MNLILHQAMTDLRAQRWLVAAWAAMLAAICAIEALKLEGSLVSLLFALSLGRVGTRLGAGHPHRARGPARRRQRLLAHPAALASHAACRQGGAHRRAAARRTRHRGAGRLSHERRRSRSASRGSRAVAAHRGVAPPADRPGRHPDSRPGTDGPRPHRLLPVLVRAAALLPVLVDGAPGIQGGARVVLDGRTCVARGRRGSRDTQRHADREAVP